jgi:hypothetical protein
MVEEAERGSSSGRVVEPTVISVLSLAAGAKSGKPAGAHP